MSSNFSLSSFSHRPLNSAGAPQHNSAAFNRDAGRKTTASGLEWPSRKWDPLSQDGGGMGGRKAERLSLSSSLQLDIEDSMEDSESCFEGLCHQFSMQESDLGPFKERLTHYDNAVALYNDFKGQKRQVRNISEVFQEVFQKLQAGDGFEGEFRAFFEKNISQLMQSSLITRSEAFALDKLAQPDGPRLQDLGLSEYEQPQGSSLNFGQRYKNSSQSNWNGDDGSMQCNVFSAPTQFDDYQKSREKRKSWLVAAMVLGLMASYPLILKPTCQAAGDLIRRMRGISVPKVQG